MAAKTNVLLGTLSGMQALWRRTIRDWMRGVERLAHLLFFDLVLATLSRSTRECSISGCVLFLQKLFGRSGKKHLSAYYVCRPGGAHNFWKNIDGSSIFAGDRLFSGRILCCILNSFAWYQYNCSPTFVKALT